MTDLIWIRLIRGYRSLWFECPALDLRDCVCTTSDCLLASFAVPDTGGVSFDGVLAAESADVSGVLSDFHLLDLLSQTGTVSSKPSVIRGICIVVGLHYLSPYLPVTPTFFVRFVMLPVSVCGWR